ncbi:MAG: hypothetical protein HY314_03870 [Acidobacteria bacterium]|nr:hypothetical protein [Acidobacteriota bacterium]
MELVKKEKIASVLLLEVTVSEDELMLYQAALSHILKTLDAAELENLFGATKEEIEGMHDDIEEILAQHSRAKVVKVAAPPKLRPTQARRKLA